MPILSSETKLLLINYERELSSLEKRIRQQMSTIPSLSLSQELPYIEQQFTSMLNSIERQKLICHKLRI